MVRCVALLRAVNLGGSTVVPMDRLRRLVEEQGFGSVRTLLASGNVVFDGTGGTPSAWEASLETAIARTFGRPTEVFVRTASEWRSLIQGNPFREAAEMDPGHLLLCVLKDAPGTSGWAALRAAVSGRERVAGSGRAAYLVYPDGVGRSQLTALRIEKALGTRGTSRNWNTVRKLAALVEPAGAA